MMLSVAVSLLSGNLKSGANSGAKSARDLCSTVWPGDVWLVIWRVWPRDVWWAGIAWGCVGSNPF